MLLSIASSSTIFGRKENIVYCLAENVDSKLNFVRIVIVFLINFAKYHFVLMLYFTSFLRWWKSTHIGEKLSFTRNRLVENFIWTVGVNSNPQLEYFRKVQTKVVTFITIIDDVYDSYGTLEELELFTEAINKLVLLVLSQKLCPFYLKIFHVYE